MRCDRCDIMLALFVFLTGFYVDFVLFADVYRKQNWSTADVAVFYIDLAGNGAVYQYIDRLTAIGTADFFFC